MPAPRIRRTTASRATRPHLPRWERKAGERPSALLEAALDAFARHGFHATRLETVAEAAGVSKGTVYTYFRNKEDLLRKAIEHRQETNKAGVEAELGNFRGSAEEKLRFFLERLWAKALTDDWGRLHKLMHGEIADEAPELYRLWIRNGLLRGWKMVAGILAEGQASGEFLPEADADALARFLLSGLMNQAFLQVHMGIGKLDAFPLERIYAAGVDTILAGIRPPVAGRAKDAARPSASRPSHSAVRRRTA
jgi:AcrR family transcriptional regulator